MPVMARAKPKTRPVEIVVEPLEIKRIHGRAYERHFGAVADLIADQGHAMVAKRVGCCSLIHRFSRLKNGRHARIQAVSANRLTRVIRTLEAPDGARLTAASRLCGMRTSVYQSAGEPNPKLLPYA